MAIIIGDIAGQLGALSRLIDKLPKDKEIICVGDLVDRGMWSPEVVQYCIDHKFTCLKGNHEDMMVDHYEGTQRYEDGLWQWNGGNATLKAYKSRNISPYPHVKWIKTLPYYVIRDNVLISHAPIPTNKRIDQEGVEFDLMWNREVPGCIIKGETGMRQVFGHNSHWGFKLFKFDVDENSRFYALCIDTSASEILTAFDTETNEIFEEPYEIPTKETVLEKMKNIMGAFK